MTLGQIATTFLRLGATGFGGPLALVALMEQEFCDRRRIVERSAFTESFVLCKMLPGPVAYQMALSVGYLLRGRVGGLVAGLSFLLPSFLMMLLLSIFYGSVHKLSGFEIFAEGLRAGSLVVILDSVLRMGKPYARDLQAWLFGLIGAFFMWRLPRGEPVIILAGGLATVLGARLWSRKASVLWSLFWVHFKAGAFTFGTGLAIVPILQAETVDVYHWLTAEQFLDAIAFGQITPGPVTIASVFIGYRVATLLGACLAAFGVYLPGAVMILGILPVLRRRLEGTTFLRRFQRGAIPTVIGCIFVASVVFGATVLTDVRSAVIFGALFLVALRWSVPSWAMIGAGGLASLLLSKA